MKFKLFLLCIIISFVASAQQKPFIGRTWMKPPTSTNSPMRMQANRNAVVSPTSSIVPDTTFYQLKAIAGLAYSFPNNQAQAVTGLSFQHIKYKYQTADAPDQSYCDYSFNLLYSLGTTTTPKIVNSNSSSFGVGIGVLNNTLVPSFLMNSYTDDITKKSTLKPTVAITYLF